MKQVNIKFNLLGVEDFEKAKELLGEEVYFISDANNVTFEEFGKLDSIRFITWTNDIYFNCNEEAFSFIIPKNFDKLQNK